MFSVSGIFSFLFGFGISEWRNQIAKKSKNKPVYSHGPPGIMKAVKGVFEAGTAFEHIKNEHRMKALEKSMF